MRKQGVVGLNPAVYWALFLPSVLSYLFHQWNVLNRVPKGGAYPTESCESNGGAIPTRWQHLYPDDKLDCFELKGNLFCRD